MSLTLKVAKEKYRFVWYVLANWRLGFNSSVIITPCIWNTILAMDYVRASSRVSITVPLLVVACIAKEKTQYKVYLKKKETEWR